MIEVFERLRADGDIDSLTDQGRRLLAGGRAPAACEKLLAALTLTHTREESYARAAAELSRALEATGDARGALTAAWYASDGRRQAELLERVPPIDRARTYSLWAARDSSRAAALHRRAAAELEARGLLVRAAIENERAGDDAAARALWSRQAQLLDGRPGESYAAGLAHFNLARTSRATGDLNGARDATVAAVHRLEEAADHFESIGQRERAFDCYHVLIAIGRFSNTFEHVLEGCVNAIRILSEDNLRYHALRLYEHSIDLAEQANERAAGATLAREMTDYARKFALKRVAARGVSRQAELWNQAAEAVLARGGPAEIAENSFLAGLLASAEAGQYSRVGAAYRRLAEMDLEESRRAHYARAAKRYQGVRDAPLEGGAIDERLGRHVEPPDVWHDDLIEWEEAGSASEACADVVLDPEEPGDGITRRNALVGRLAALAAEARDTSRDERAATVLARYLAPIELYVLLSPLERLFTHRSGRVRLETVKALSRYFYKRTFITLQRALRDPDGTVVAEATDTITRLNFDHAFDPLSRIYGSAESPRVRAAAVRALARIDLRESAELLLQALDFGGPEERDAAISALRNARGTHFLEIARTALPTATPRLSQAIRAVFEARGVRA